MLPSVPKEVADIQRLEAIMGWIKVNKLMLRSDKMKVLLVETDSTLERGISPA